ncbi:hypothetical protein I6A60_19070 [Frankia sp. AgB1.9]|uniref:hypothetical protein n=1 Tax=unclassified Frankia TaxID=2632575 RepID=UPI0019318B0F|nr:MULTISPECIES: hypothetical protein [unclassified Frankia]MBL7487897.1 hypothetical protein [Frankia sp. AgW1.1]MBL7549962.1 hypothetical protein [Frankia sp. AgB1.9]MBL7621459.1 hypothetical protein [Frankia sp. AgB1.8]
MLKIWTEVIVLNDGDLEEYEMLSWGLKEELLGQGVDDLEYDSNSAPGGSKGLGDAALILGWAVSSGALRAFVHILESWLARQPAAGIKVEIGEDCLIIDKATGADKKAILDDWVTRHSGS